MKTKCINCGAEGEVPLPFPDYSIRCYCGVCVHLPESKEATMSSKDVENAIKNHDKILDAQIIGD